MESDRHLGTVLHHSSHDLPQVTDGEQDRDGRGKSILSDVGVLYEESRNGDYAVVGGSATSPTIPNRFARSFTDPAFPCVAVRYAVAKRIVDLIVSTLLLILLAPISVLIAIVIKATSPGPVIFKQVRVGRGGRLFWCYKFRSMCVDAEKKRHTLLHLNEVSGPVFKIRRDPRITPVGAFIRKFSVDEIPQLINVIKGDMSLVGPRPPLPGEVENYNARQRGRLAVQPGLTCLWQIQGRSNIGFERWVELDLIYIDTMSFSNDLKILLKTIPAVLTGYGAH